jgi:hypothetical protein
VEEHIDLQRLAAARIPGEEGDGNGIKTRWEETVEVVVKFGGLRYWGWMATCD